MQKSRAYFEYLSHPFRALQGPAPPVSCVNKTSPLSPVSRPQSVRAFVADCTASTRVEETGPHPRVKMTAMPRPLSTWLPVPCPLVSPRGRSLFLIRSINWDGHFSICRCSLFLRPTFVLYWAAKTCKRFTIPHKLPLIISMCIVLPWQAQANVSSDSVNLISACTAS